MYVCIMHMISLNLTQEHWEMIKRDGISPTAVMRKALDEIQQYKTGELLDTTASLSAKVQRLIKHIEGYTDFLNERGLMNEFLAKSESK